MNISNASLIRLISTAIAACGIVFILAHDNFDSSRGQQPPMQIDKEVIGVIDTADTGMPTDDGPDTSLAAHFVPIPKPSPVVKFVPSTLDETLLPDPPTEAFDDGEPDPLSGRTAAFERWCKNNTDLWEGMDSQIRDCVRTQYVNAFGTSPEAGVDQCLDFFGNGD